MSGRRLRTGLGTGVGAALLAVACLQSGCATGFRSRPPEHGVDAAAPALAGEQAAQSLYRVDVEGAEGRGRMRLVLREGPRIFQLAASDALGRALWTLTVAETRALLVDHRRRLYCSDAEAVVPPQAGLAELPLAALPRVLAGRLPIAPRAAPPGDDRLDFEDDAGRRWSAVFEAGAPSSWTLWEQDEPLLWWSAAPRGGILSHRQGSQFRWRMTVREEGAGKIAGEIPEGYALGACSTWDESMAPG